MNREIKFRGQTDLKKWVYGYVYHCFESDKYFIIDYSTGFNYEVDPKTVGQYTGIKDKNLKEIYEADVLSDGAVVEWVNHLGWDGGGSDHPGFYCRRWGNSSGDNYIELGYFDGFDMSEIHSNDNDGLVEIIGNVHDNPELLQKCQQ